MRLAGSTALVTGANRGLGRAFAEALLARGATKVYAAARRPDLLADLAAAHGDRLVPLRLDITDADQVAAAARAAPDVDLLVNNAGLLTGGGLLEAGSVAPLQAELDVNAIGLARMALAFVPAIRARAAAGSGGAIVNMLAIGALCAAPHFGTYCASKMAAMALTQGLRCDLAPDGVEVFGIYAGLVDTDMVGHVDRPKSSPAAIVARALDGVAAGEAEIDADEAAVALRRAMRQDPEAALTAMFARAAAFRAERRPDRPVSMREQMSMENRMTREEEAG